MRAAISREEGAAAIQAFAGCRGPSPAHQLGENALTVFTQSDLWKHVLRILIVGLVILGSAAPGATSVFFFSDPMMGVLALVNLLTITMLFPVALRVLNDYRNQLGAGTEHPVFDPARFSDLDIDASAWKLDPVDAAGVAAGVPGRAE